MHEEADKRFRANAEKMQLKYCKGKRKKIKAFCHGSFVSVRIPRTDHVSTDRHRLPCVVVTDNILAASQRLLQRQTGAHGLQPPCIGQMCAFDIQKGDFIQIVNNGHAHWLTISTIGAVDGTVNVYDSLYMSVSSCVKNQVAAIVYTNKKVITLNFIDVQM